MTGLRVTLAGEAVHLLPQRAIWWPARSTLFLADLHLGKSATFRRGGIPVPRGVTAADLERLGGLLTMLEARRVIILGDMYHARTGRNSAETHRVLADWRSRHPIPMVLVRGNHDTHAGDPPAELAISCVDGPLREPPFALAHRPGTCTDAFELAGHVHPGVRLRGSGRWRERLPCFAVSPRAAILPAFGGFTGMHLVEPSSDLTIYAVAGDEVLPVTRR